MESFSSLACQGREAIPGSIAVKGRCASHGCSFGAESRGFAQARILCGLLSPIKPRGGRRDGGDGGDGGHGDAVLGVMG
jgi:hypothetical protein